MQVQIGGGRRPRQKQPILAAALRRRVVNGRLDIRTYEWQKRNWDLFDRVGVVGYGSMLTYNTLSKMQVIAAILPENPDDDPEPITSGIEVDLVNAFRGPFGEAPHLAATAALNFQIAGEGYILGTEEEGYDVVSSEQLGLIGQSTVLYGPDGQVVRRLSDDDYVARIWRAHPRFREMPHAPLTHVADDCLEWLLLSRRSRGQLRTRMSAGFMFIPNEIKPSRMQQFTEADEEAEDEWEEPFGANAPEADPLMEELIEIMTAPLLDEDDLAGVVPWLLTGPGEQGQHIVQQPWRRSEEESSDSERRKELIRSIAVGLDWPVEKILGMGDSSYWNAWQIDQSAFEEHMDPLGMEVLRSITAGWYRPMLEEMGMSREEAQRRIMWRDLSAFQSEPDWAIAHEAHAASVISDEALRRYGRFMDDDAPDEEELERRRPVVIEVPAEEDEAPDADNPGPATPSSEEGDEVAASVITAALQPVSLMQQTAKRLAAIDRGLLARITTAGDRELTRALERAGARLRSATRNDQSMAALLKKTANEQIGLHLGADYVRQQLQLSDAELVPEGTFRKFETDVDRWLAQAQDAAAGEVEGLSGEPVNREREEEEAQRGMAVELILGLLAGLAISRLFTPAPSPDEGEIPETLIPPGPVMDAMSVAGGGGMDAPIGESFDQGVGNGRYSRGWLESAGFFTEAYRWVYGDPSARDANFEPHRRLDGLQFSSWEEPGLANPGGWPGVGHFYPQDHGGCLCNYERMFCESVVAAAEGNPCGPVLAPALGAETEKREV